MLRTGGVVEVAVLTDPVVSNGLIVFLPTRPSLFCSDEVLVKIVS